MQRESYGKRGAWGVRSRGHPNFAGFRQTISSDLYVPLTESRPFAEKETGILILILSPFRANQPKGTAMFIFDLLGSLISIALIALVVAALTGNLFFVVKQ